MTNFPELERNIEKFHNEMAEHIKAIAPDDELRDSILHLNTELRQYGLEVLTATDPKMGILSESISKIQAEVMKLPEENTARQDLSSTLDQLSKVNEKYAAMNRYMVNQAKENTELLSSDDLDDLEVDQ